MIRSVGYDIRKRGAFGRTLGDALLHLGRVGFEPATVVDVGVERGTPDLYSSYPRARYLLLEPLQEFEPRLVELCKRLNGQYVLAAAGPRRGIAHLHVHPDLGATTSRSEMDGSDRRWSVRAVPVVTLDDVANEYHLESPILLKLDVQGAELDVLAGAPHTLSATEVVVAEVSLFEVLRGQPQFYDVVQWMKQAGFVVYDFCDAKPRPYDSAIAQVDLVFVKESGKLRSYHGWWPESQARSSWFT
jgi:FkbM family methyltransferase